MATTKPAASADRIRTPNGRRTDRKTDRSGIRGRRTDRRTDGSGIRARRADRGIEEIGIPSR
jgi:hypothetical protein